MGLTKQCLSGVGPVGQPRDGGGHGALGWPLGREREAGLVARAGPKGIEGEGEMGRDLPRGKEKENRPLGRNRGRWSVLFLLYI